MKLKVNLKLVTSKDSYIPVVNYCFHFARTVMLLLEIISYT